ncbi:MAG: hypothetical protein ACRC1H_14950 [Caldilineaceae bacterium]
MAYSLGDPYRSLRLVLRTNGVLLGLLPGMALLLAGSRLPTALGFAAGGPLLPYRLAGAAFVAIGIFLLGAAARPDVDRAALLGCITFHALVALALLLGYLGGDLVVANFLALIVLLVVFLLCLLGALAPLRYFGPEYRL